MKQLLGGAAAAGIDQLADIGIARRQHAVKRRIDFFKGLQLLEAFDVVRGGIHHGLFGVSIAHGVVNILLGHGIAFQQVLVTRGGGLRQVRSWLWR